MFYEHPVELEHVVSTDADQEFLAFDLIAHQARLHLLIRDEPWKIRLPESAGPIHQKIAAFTAKRHSVLRHVWPPDDRQDQLQALHRMFVQAGFSRSQLR